jgi:hypothetical protein
MIIDLESHWGLGFGVEINCLVLSCLLYNDLKILLSE